MHDGARPRGGAVATVDKARALLLAWNFSVDADSVAAGIYEMWQRRVSANIRNLVVPKEAQSFIGQPSMKRVIDWLNAPDGRFGSREESAMSTLPDATSC